MANWIFGVDEDEKPIWVNADNAITVRSLDPGKTTIRFAAGGERGTVDVTLKMDMNAFMNTLKGR